MSRLYQIVVFPFALLAVFSSQADTVTVVTEHLSPYQIVHADGTSIEDDVSLHFLVSRGFEEGRNLYPVKNYESLLQLLEKRSQLIDLIMLNDELLHHRRQNPIQLKKHDNFTAFSIDFYLACHVNAAPNLLEVLKQATRKVSARKTNR